MAFCTLIEMKLSAMNKTRYTWITLCIGLIGFLSSCEKPIAVEDPDLLNKLYSESKDTIEIESSKYILETELYRDFMPGALFPSKRPLSALVILLNLDSITIPSTLNITKLYIIKDQLIWTSIPKDSNRNQIPDFRLYKVSTDGPEWETEKPVDVVIEITNNLNNDKFLLIAKQQYIIRLE
jgi:hypothetical protein